MHFNEVGGSKGDGMQRGWAKMVDRFDSNDKLICQPCVRCSQEDLLYRC